MVHQHRRSVRTWVTDDLGLAENTADNLVNRALIVDAWDAAKRRIEAQVDLEAQARAQGTPLALLQGDHLRLRRAFRDAYGEIKDNVCPSRGWLDRRFEQMEHGELKFD